MLTFLDYQFGVYIKMPSKLYKYPRTQSSYRVYGSMKVLVTGTVGFKGYNSDSAGSFWAGDSRSRS